MYEGICEGGPLHGLRLTSRFPKGVLLVDKPAGACWLYEWQSEQGMFTVRDERPMVVQTHGHVNRYRAAEEANYDVIAAPWVVSADDDGGEVPGGDPRL